MKLWGNIVKGIELVNKIDAHVIVLGSFNWSSEQQQQQKYHMCQYDICQSCGNCTEGTDSKQIDYYFFFFNKNTPSFSQSHIFNLYTQYFSTTRYISLCFIEHDVKKDSENYQLKITQDLWSISFKFCMYSIFMLANTAGSSSYSTISFSVE